jgi:hypothetical protein
MPIEKRETLQKQGVETVVVFSDAEAAIWRTAHLVPGPGQWLARRINSIARCLCAHGIATKINSGAGQSGILGYKEADCQANVARDASESTVIERPHRLGSNSVRWISERSSAAKAKWEADKCSKHFSYRLKSKAGTKKPILMTSIKSVAARFYRLKSKHVPTGVYLERFGYRADGKCWWYGGTPTQTQMREQLFRHCSCWRDQQKALWKAVENATGWKAGRCRHMQVCVLFSIEEYNKGVMDFLAVVKVGKFPPKLSCGMERARGSRLKSAGGGYPVILFLFFLDVSYFITISYLIFQL